MTNQFANERPLPPIDNCVIMGNTYYAPAHLRASAEWARGKLAGVCSAWERRYLQSQIERIELALLTGRAA